MVDVLVAGSRKDLFGKESFRLNKVLDSSSVYGVVLGGDARKLQSCFVMYIKENGDEFSRHIEKMTPQIAVGGGRRFTVSLLSNLILQKKNIYIYINK